MTLQADERSAVPAPVSRQNNVGLLRLVLAFLVLISHSPELVDGNRSRELLTRLFHTLSFGEVAVDGFFILSGALITASYLNSHSPVGYLGKRILRIYPGFIASFLFCVFLVAPAVGGSLDLQSPAFWWQIVRRSLLLRMPDVPGAMEGNPYPVLNGSMWTIRYEFSAYLAVLLFGLLGMLRRRRFVLALTVALIVAYPVWQSSSLDGWRDALAPNQSLIGNSVRFLGLFASGASFHLYRDVVVYRHRWAAMAALFLLLSLLSIETAHVGVATVGAYLLLFVALHVRFERLSRVGTKNDISYGVYLYAWPVQSVIVWHAPGISPWLLLFLSACITSVLAYLSWVAVERPALRLKFALGYAIASPGATTEKMQ